MSYKSIKTRVIGVDIKKDITTYAVVDIRGTIIAKEQFQTTDYPDISDFVSELSNRIISISEANGGYDNIRSLGISVNSGNNYTGCIENAANMPWKGVVPLAAMLRDRLGMAVALSNNAHVSALGEFVFGSAHGMKNFIVVTLGSGMGSCFFSRGKVHLGADGFAGEIGHTKVADNGRLCGCGHHGCLETYCSARGIETTAHELISTTDLPSKLREKSDFVLNDIIDCCKADDPLAVETMKRTGKMLGLGIANYASLINPEAVIFTGRVAKAGDYLFEPAYETFEQRVYKNLKGRTKFLQSILDNQERDVLGASVLAWGIKEYSLFK